MKIKKYWKKKYALSSNECIIISFKYDSNFILKIIILKYIKVIINISIIIRYFFIIINFYIILNSYKYYYNEIKNLRISSSDETIIMKRDKKLRFYLTSKMVRKYNSYIKKCLKNNDKYTIPIYTKPKITAIIPLFNAESYLKYSLTSIQNQNMKEIEIILIDDCSKDNTNIEVKKYMKKDKRIRLIKNKKNRQILYSKSIAALNANAKYIIQLDQDDMFIREDLFDILYNEAELNQLDLLQFRDLYLNKFKIPRKVLVNRKGRHYIFKIDKFNKDFVQAQPELENEMFIKGNVYLLWGLLIKNDLYKKAIYHLWPLIINYKIIYYEDYIITSIMIIFSQKYKYLNYFGLIHFKHTNNAMTKSHDQFYSALLFCQYNLYNFYIKNHPKHIQILMNYIIRYEKKYKNCSELDPNFFAFNIRKIINNQYIKYQDLQFISKKFNISFQKFEEWNSYKYFLSDSIYKEIYDYQSLCSTNSEPINNNINEKYKISIIIYCVRFKYLDKTLNSILNQKDIDLEIILIYDNVHYEHIKEIKTYIKKYKNILLVNNKIKKGFLYSYSFGVLVSKGDYILILKSGETLTTNSVMNSLYSKLFKSNFDILEFNLLINENKEIKKNSLRLYECQHIKNNINITTFKYKNNNDEVDQEDELITNKLIETNLFKKIINKYKLNECQNKLYSHYDNIILFLLFREGAKLKRTSFYGVVKYILIINKLYSSYLEDNNNKISDSIFYINFLFNNTLESFKEKRIVIKEFYNLLSIIYNKFNRFNHESKKLYLKFLDCKYIPQSEKKKFILYYNYLNN